MYRHLQARSSYAEHAPITRSAVQVLHGGAPGMLTARTCCQRGSTALPPRCGLSCPCICDWQSGGSTVVPASHFNRGLVAWLAFSRAHILLLLSKVSSCSVHVLSAQSKGSKRVGEADIAASHECAANTRPVTLDLHEPARTWGTHRHLARKGSASQLELSTGSKYADGWEAGLSLSCQVSTLCQAASIRLAGAFRIFVLPEQLLQLPPGSRIRLCGPKLCQHPCPNTCAYQGVASEGCSISRQPEKCSKCMAEGWAAQKREREICSGQTEVPASRKSKSVGSDGMED